MGKPSGFLEYTRKQIIDRDPAERIKDFNEFHHHLDENERKNQGARCMDCGVPFCQSSYGCPIDNLIPEWNDLIYNGRWEDAYVRLRQTNNFPEFTGRVCPAPCETACVLGITDPAVTIKDNECTIIDRAWDTGLVQPQIPADEKRTGKKVAIVGSGPAGLAAADQLNQAGHSVVVFERDDRIGGLLMYGIPNMKLEKDVVQRRVDLMTKEGVEFRTGVDVGRDITLDQLESEYDAILIAAGASQPRDLDVPGRKFAGVHFAMEYLSAATKTLLDSGNPDSAPIHTKDKNVIVIGGGDTGNDCIGTAVRQGAASVINFELLPEPPAERTADMPWPTYPRLYKTDYGHAEAYAVFGRDPREFSILTKEFIGNEQGKLVGLKTVRVEWVQTENGPRMQEIPGSEESWKADFVFLALGFTGPEASLTQHFMLETDARSNIAAEYGRFATSRPKIYAAGDVRRGQSLVVWAINEGRAAAREIDRDLVGNTELP